MTGVPRTELEISGSSHPTDDTWVLYFPWPTNPMPMNGSRGAHWGPHARKSRTTRTAVHYSALAAKIPALGKCEVQLIWWVATNGRRDPANLAALEKPMFDALVDAGVVPDDNPTYMTTPRAEIRHYHQGAGFVTGPGFTLHIRRITPDPEWED